MSESFKLSLLFVLPTFVLGIFEGIYLVFVRNQIDTKYSTSWNAMKASFAIVCLICVCLFATFFVLNILSNKINKLDLSRKSALQIGCVVWAITFSIGKIRFYFFNYHYDPIDMGNIIITFIFITLNLKKYFKTKKT